MGWKKVRGFGSVQLFISNNDHICETINIYELSISSNLFYFLGLITFVCSFSPSLGGHILIFIKIWVLKIALNDQQDRQTQISNES